MTTPTNLATKERKGKREHETNISGVNGGEVQKEIKIRKFVEVLSVGLLKSIFNMKY